MAPARKPRRHLPGVLQRLPRHLQAHPLLGVQAVGLARGDRPELGVEHVDPVHKAAPLAVQLPGRLVVWVVELVHVKALSWVLGHGVAPVLQKVPVRVQRVAAARELARHTDHGNALVSSSSRNSSPADRTLHMQRHSSSNILLVLCGCRCSTLGRELCEVFGESVDGGEVVDDVGADLEADPLAELCGNVHHSHALKPIVAQGRRGVKLAGLHMQCVSKVANKPVVDLVGSAERDVAFTFFLKCFFFFLLFFLFHLLFNFLSSVEFLLADTREERCCGCVLCPVDAGKERSRDVTGEELRENSKDV